MCAGFEKLLASGGSFLIEQGRIDLAVEFIRAMESVAEANFGVLLSGPNGIGEVTVGLMLVYLNSQRGIAAGMLVACVSPDDHRRSCD